MHLPLPPSPLSLALAYGLGFYVGYVIAFQWQFCVLVPFNYLFPKPRTTPSVNYAFFPLYYFDSYPSAFDLGVCVHFHPYCL